MKVKTFFGKIVKISQEVRKFFWNRGEIWSRGNASWSQGGWTPLREKQFLST